MESYSIFVFLVGQHIDDVDGLFTSAQRYHSSTYWFRHLVRCVLHFILGIAVELTVRSGGNSADICHVRFASCLLVSHPTLTAFTIFCRPQRVMHSILSCRILLHVRKTDRAMREALPSQTELSSFQHYRASLAQN